MDEFTSDFDHRISLADAAGMTKMYRDNNSQNTKLGGLFGKDDVISLLNQMDCAGIRFYFAINSTNELCVVLVGADGNGDDLVNGLILDKSFPCPNMCGASNDLNSD